MLEIFKKEASELYKFLNGHEGIKSIEIDNKNTTITLNITIEKHDAANWNQVQNIFEQYFRSKYDYDLKINYTNLFPPGMLDDEESLVVVSKAKTPPQPIVIFATDKNDWRLFRFYSQSRKSNSNDYFKPNMDIAKKEISNLEDAYHHILEDMKQKTFTRNIIELNINCLNSNDLKDMYIDALRKLPQQLKNRIAISLVRIPQDASVHTLRQAALICKLCTDNIFLSLQYSNELERDKLKQIYGVSGFIITVPKDSAKDFEDIKKIYDKLNAVFAGKRTFVIFSDSQNMDNTYKSSKILTLKEREKIGVKSD